MWSRRVTSSSALNATVYLENLAKISQKQQVKRIIKKAKTMTMMIMAVMMVDALFHKKLQGVLKHFYYDFFKFKSLIN